MRRTKEIYLIIGAGIIILGSLFFLKINNKQETQELNDNQEKINQSTMPTQVVTQGEVASKENANIAEAQELSVPVISEQIIEDYEDGLSENERSIVTTRDLVSNEIISQSSTNGRHEVATLEDLLTKLQKASLEFYLPKYIPQGFKVNNIGITYYLNSNNFDLAMKPSREDILAEGGTISVYEMGPKYKESIQEIMLEYSNGKEKISYSFGLSFLPGENINQGVNQFQKDSFDEDLNIAVANKVQINQQVEPVEVFTGIPTEWNKAYNYPDYFKSIEIRIDAPTLTDEEILKVANSIYKVN